MKFDDRLFLGNALGIPRLQRRASRVGFAGVIAGGGRRRRWSAEGGVERRWLGRFLFTCEQKGRALAY